MNKTLKDVEKLAEDIKQKIISESLVIQRAKKEITIRVFQRDKGFDIQLDLSI